MNLSCQLAQILSTILFVFRIFLLVYAVVSWVPSLRGAWTIYVDRVVEPVLMPVRRVIPPIGGFDLSFLVVILLVSYLISWLPNSVCYRYY